MTVRTLYLYKVVQYTKLKFEISALQIGLQPKLAIKGGWHFVLTLLITLLTELNF